MLFIVASQLVRCLYVKDICIRKVFAQRFRNDICILLFYSYQVTISQKHWITGGGGLQCTGNVLPTALFNRLAALEMLPY